MIYKITEMLFPILLAFVIGNSARVRGWMDDKGCETVKTLITRIILPVTLFNAMLFSDYSSNTIVLIVTTFFIFASIFVCSCILSRILPNRKKYFPFAISSWECGSLGVPLTAMLLGQSMVGKIAVMDFGQAIFLFAIQIPLLQATEGGKPSAGKMLKLVFSSQSFDAIILGALLGICGFASVLSSSAWIHSYTTLVNSITGSLGFLIMFTIGYGFELKRELMKDVMITVLIRIVLFSLGCFVLSTIVFRFIDFNRDLMKVFIIGFSLPTSFGIVSFGKFEGNRDYVSGIISVSTLICLIVFILLVLF